MLTTRVTNQIGLKISALLALTVFVTPFSRADDWPQWRGPNRTGISAERGLLDEWPASGPSLVWQANGAGSGYSTMSVSGDRLVTLGNIERDGEEAEYVLAYSVESGRQLWATKIGKPFRNNRGNGPRSCPTVQHDRVYALGGNADLVCLDRATGNRVWHLNLFERFGGRNIKWGISESPLVDGDRVIVNAGGDAASIVALDKHSGELVWKSEDLNDRPGYSSAMAVDVDGVRQILHFTAEAAVGVRASDGKLLWRYTPVANKTANVATAIFHDNRVFYSTAYNTGCALLKLSGGNTPSADEVYFSREMMNHHASSVLIDGYLYGFSNQMLISMEFATGNVAWRHRSVGKGSLVYADGRLYCFSERGDVGLVEATPSEYRERGRFKIEAGDWPTWSHPVVSGGRLFLRDQESIYCYDVQGKSR